MTVYRIESSKSLININRTGYFRKELCHDNKNLFALFYFTKLDEVFVQKSVDCEKFICKFEIDTEFYEICKDLTITTADAYYLNLENFSNEQIIIKPSDIQVYNCGWFSLEAFISPYI
ncbi:hypothetical protein HUX57_11285 [Arcobacter butzleri]|uniref:hypothetical protein n=1 Tax=Aliarcobacter butzleri TaxID=28197 RepID=UPI0015876BD6|nr:hypothetical protein [Aliarcobacter butzleri]NUW27240.1 hypothetical protein [Aliarcobacter butzleri]